MHRCAAPSCRTGRPRLRKTTRFSPRQTHAVRIRAQRGETLALSASDCCTARDFLEPTRRLGPSLEKEVFASLNLSAVVGRLRERSASRAPRSTPNRRGARILPPLNEQTRHPARRLRGSGGRPPSNVNGRIPLRQRARLRPSENRPTWSWAGAWPDSISQRSSANAAPIPF